MDFRELDLESEIIKRLKKKVLCFILIWLTFLMRSKSRKRFSFGD